MSNKGKLPLRGLLSIAVACGAVAAVAWNAFGGNGTASLFPPEMEAIRHSKRDVVGDLGGVPVTIPKHFADFAEYEGDPGWGERHSGSGNKRTHQSKLRSFGFYVRFPDMAGTSTPELVADKQTQTIYQTTWISVGINAATNYSGWGSLDRLAARIVDEPGRPYRYGKRSEELHGLTAYEALGVDPKTGQPLREIEDTIFVHHDGSGRVDAYIKCSVVRHEAAPCRHYFTLEPEMNAQVYLDYRRGLLPQWKSVQHSVGEHIKGFRVSPPNDPRR